ncbi:hypothetical protein GCM10009821_10740 [Aeromicrobium halocynthiae]|uniref:Signal peptidase I n=2 Tax=Aeromicrobium halocynthiae TaxID=560557 RepID=A0ABN2VVN4_9ACTN
MVLLGPSLSSATFTSVTTPALATVQAASDWTPPTVALNAPAPAVRGTVTLTATASDADSGVPDVRIQARAAGASSWTTICTVTTSPYSCAWATGTANGAHELRAVATDRAGNTATSAVRTTLVDNQAPSVTMNDPGALLTGTTTFSASASDAGSGVAQVVIQASSNGSSWTTLCTRTSSPYSCAYDTKQLANGTYSVRAVATDVVGNSATSATVTGRVVDNTPRAVTLADPGSPLSGTVNVDATASAPGGVTSVAIQRSPAGANQWTTICTASSAPYRCSWNTTGVTDGLYDLRAVMADSQGTLTSAPVGARRVFNAPLAAADIQAAHGGSAIGRPDAGDRITYTFNREVDLGSILSGWDRGSRSVTGRFTSNLFFSDSTLSIDGTQLGIIDLGARYNNFLNGTTTFTATMTASTDTATGTPRTVVTVVLTSSPNLANPGGTPTMVWTPAAVRDTLGRAIAASSATESGPASRDF